MIIQSSNVTLSSERKFQTTSRTTSKVTCWGGKGLFSYMLEDDLCKKEDGLNLGNESGKDDDSVEKEKRSKYQGLSVLGERAMYSRIARMKALGLENKRIDEVDTIRKLQNKLVNNILRILWGEKSDFNNECQNSDMELYPMQEEGGEYYEFTSYWESEELSMSANALVKTSDGREINLDYNIHMSRGFYQSIEQRAGFGAEYCIDPLVISLDGTLPELSTMDFYFDLDGDGGKEKISSLGEKSGFLALDKNGDGIINDGSELFGTKSGDGFLDLSEYDLDKNGWIDEADEIFTKLRIWVRAGNSDAKLMTLKEAGVGAICLKNTDGEFKLQGQNNMANAYIRKTGMFLYESGIAGSIAHVDMVDKTETEVSNN